MTNRCSKSILAFSEYFSNFSPLEFYILWRFVFLKYLLVLCFTDCNLVPSTTPISSVCWAAPLIYETDFRSILILSLSPRGLIMLISSSTLLFLGYSTISALHNSQFILFSQLTSDWLPLINKAGGWSICTYTRSCACEMAILGMSSLTGIMEIILSYLIQVISCRLLHVVWSLWWTFMTSICANEPLFIGLFVIWCFCLLFTFWWMAILD